MKATKQKVRSTSKKYNATIRSLAKDLRASITKGPVGERYDVGKLISLFATAATRRIIIHDRKLNVVIKKLRKIVREL